MSKMLDVILYPLIGVAVGLYLCIEISSWLMPLPILFGWWLVVRWLDHDPQHTRGDK